MSGSTAHWVIHPLQPTQESQLKLIHETVKAKASNYLWNQNNFQFKLKGYLHFGNAIDDLWFLTDIIFQISQLLPCIISLNDDNDQFLLIEACDHINQQYDPSNVENRVWIKDGKLHIIPLNVPVTNLKDAFNAMANDKISTICSEKVQETISLRLSRFSPPFTNIHVHNVILPNGIAKVLYNQPRLVTVFAHAFWDYIQLKINLDQLRQKMAPTTPETLIPPNSKEYVKVSVKFTRLIYAQLLSIDLGTDQCKSIDLGTKLKLGYDLVYSSVSNADDEIVKEIRNIIKMDSLSNYEILENDSDDWMNIDEEYFEKLEMNVKSSDIINDIDTDSCDHSQNSQSERDIEEEPILNTLEKVQIDKFGDIFNIFDEFSQRQSDVRGVLQLDEDSSDDDEPVQLNPDKFMETLSSKVRSEDDENRSQSGDEEQEMDEEIKMHIKNQDGEDDDDEVNLIKNIMASLEIQQGGSGPATTLFNNLGLKF
jgi:hypothetical protein